MPSLNAIKEMSDDVIRMNTSKTMVEWKRILDKFAAREKSQERVTKHIIDCYSVNSYWSQVIVAKYFM